MEILCPALVMLIMVFLRNSSGDRTTNKTWLRNNTPPTPETQDDYTWLAKHELSDWLFRDSKAGIPVYPALLYHDENGSWSPVDEEKGTMHRF